MSRYVSRSHTDEANLIMNRKENTMSQPQTKERLKPNSKNSWHCVKRTLSLRTSVLLDNMKVSPKGAISFYGLGRFPVTLYASQWEKLVAAAKEGLIEDFIKANARYLAKDIRQTETKATDEVLIQDNQQ